MGGKRRRYKNRQLTKEKIRYLNSCKRDVSTNTIDEEEGSLGDEVNIDVAITTADEDCNISDINSNANIALSEEISRLEEENAKYIKLIEIKDNENKITAAALEDKLKRKKNHKKIIKENKDELIHLRDEKSRNCEKIKDLQIRLENVANLSKEKCEEEKLNEEKNKNIETELEILRKRNDESQKIMRKLRKVKEMNEKELQKLREYKLNSEIILQNSEERDIEINKLREENETQKSLYVELKDQNKLMDSQLRESKQTNEQYATEIEQLREFNNLTEIEKHSIKNDDTFITDFNILQETNKRLVKEIWKLRDESIQTKFEVDNLRESNIFYEDEMSHLTKKEFAAKTEFPNEANYKSLKDHKEIFDKLQCYKFEMEELQIANKSLQEEFFETLQMYKVDQQVWKETCESQMLSLKEKYECEQRELREETEKDLKILHKELRKSHKKNKDLEKFNESGETQAQQFFETKLYYEEELQNLRENDQICENKLKSSKEQQKRLEYQIEDLLKQLAKGSEDCEDLCVTLREQVSLSMNLEEQNKHYQSVFNLIRKELGIDNVAIEGNLGKGGEIVSVLKRLELMRMKHEDEQEALATCIEEMQQNIYSLERIIDEKEYTENKLMRELEQKCEKFDEKTSTKTDKIKDHQNKLEERLKEKEKLILNLFEKIQGENQTDDLEKIKREHQTDDYKLKKRQRLSRSSKIDRTITQDIELKEKTYGNFLANDAVAFVMQDYCNAEVTTSRNEVANINIEVSPCDFNNNIVEETKKTKEYENVIENKETDLAIMKTQLEHVKQTKEEFIVFINEACKVVLKSLRKFQRYLKEPCAMYRRLGKLAKAAYMLDKLIYEAEVSFGMFVK